MSEPAPGPEVLPPENAKPPEELPPTELEKLVGRARPWAEKYGWIVGIAAAVAVVALIGVSAALSPGGDPASWAAFGDALERRDTAVTSLDAVAAEHVGSDAALWARLIAAEQLVDSGVAAIFRDRVAGLQDLGEAKDRFDGLLADAPLPDVEQRALFGIATAIEASASSEEDVKAAIAAYERLLKAYPESLFTDAATERVEDLGAGGAGEFYTWFAAQNPSPAGLDTPDDSSAPGEVSETSDADAIDFSDLIEGIDDAPAGGDAGAE